MEESSTKGGVDSQQKKGSGGACVLLRPKQERETIYGDVRDLELEDLAHFDDFPGGRHRPVSRCWASDVKDVRRLFIRHGVNASAANRTGWLFLRDACRDNERPDEYFDVVRYLVKNRVNVNREDAKGRTVLHHAVRGGNLGIVKCLVEEGGADITGKCDDYGRMPYSCVDDLSGDTRLAVKKYFDRILVSRYRPTCLAVLLLGIRTGLPRLVMQQVLEFLPEAWNHDRYAAEKIIISSD